MAIYELKFSGSSAFEGQEILNVYPRGTSVVGTVQITTDATVESSFTSVDRLSGEVFRSFETYSGFLVDGTVAVGEDIYDVTLGGLSIEIDTNYFNQNVPDTLSFDFTFDAFKNGIGARWSVKFEMPTTLSEVNLEDALAEGDLGPLLPGGSPSLNGLYAGAQGPNLFTENTSFSLDRLNEMPPASEVPLPGAAFLIFPALVVAFARSRLKA
ncbi:hypothetical protein HK107_14130 [Parvularcula sp. ZS-1/3]|uniref:Uncharacterized protein n=1 Tax=Parvularcula mediterranea TaxID=2732508 RepID=A0A7Y3W6L5_9PROT|nr:hypothetical protein [Parvularcula mediterranea]NNU17467.1 hypothetical protein [Parvularcula mediterranea]